MPRFHRMWPGEFWARQVTVRVPIGDMQGLGYNSGFRRGRPSAQAIMEHKCAHQVYLPVSGNQV